MVGILQGCCSISSGKRNDTRNDAEVDGRLGVSRSPENLFFSPSKLRIHPFPDSSSLRGDLAI